jgi:hypothetical protein
MYLPIVSNTLKVVIMNSTSQSGLLIKVREVLFVVPGNTKNVNT